VLSLSASTAASE